ncbi:MAG: co-chaperone GroES [Rhodoplanes sp.]|jgi:chaperonin GroES
MKFRPLHDRVVLKRIEAEEKSSGGIIIPDTAKEKPQQGEVAAVGPGGRDDAGKLIPIDLKAGDRVLFGKWSGTEVKIDGVNSTKNLCEHLKGYPTSTEGYHDIGIPAVAAARCCEQKHER